MNFLEELKTLDPRDPGRWPLAVRAFFVALIFTVCAGFAWYLLVWNQDRPVLQKAEADELDLRSQFESSLGNSASLVPRIPNASSDTKCRTLSGRSPAYTPATFPPRLCPTRSTR